jgi:glycosyltransferase involved in cell wall biosynthesis
VKEISYILLTPCKNEENNLQHLINSIVDQTVKPKLWVIIDDGSTDNTSKIIAKAEKEHLWIKSIQLKPKKRDLGKNLAKTLKKGFEFAESLCETNNIEYSYLANVDADLRLEETFFGNLINEFEEDPLLGIASGGTKHLIGNKLIQAKLRYDEPSGGHMVIRKKCFDDCDGFPISYNYDSVLKAKARLRGWKTRRFEENIAIECRDVNSAEGYWKGFFNKGEASYYLNHNPIHVLARSIKYLMKRPFYIGFAYILGYISFSLMKRDKLPDIEVKKYYWNKWKQILINFLRFKKSHP